MEESLVRLPSQSISAVFRKGYVQGTLDGLGFGFGSQGLLGTLNFSGVQLKMFVRSLCGRGHWLPSP
jgi:hypothetical protein